MLIVYVSSLLVQGSGNLDAIHIIKKTGGSLLNSYLEEGFILEKRFGVGQPKRLEKPKILIGNTPMDTDKIKVFGAKLKTDSVAVVGEVEQAEKARMREKCQKIIDHGITCFINRQLIYNLPEEYFADHGVSTIGTYHTQTPHTAWHRTPCSLLPATHVDARALCRAR